jgi:hypothetical protein
MYKIKGFKISINNINLNLQENIKFDLMSDILNLKTGTKIFIKDGYITTSNRYGGPNYIIKEISVVDGYLSINCEKDESINTMYDCIKDLDNNKVFIDLSQIGSNLVDVKTLKNLYRNSKNKDYRLIIQKTNSHSDFIHAIKCVSLDLILYKEKKI